MNFESFDRFHRRQRSRRDPAGELRRRAEALLAEADEIRGLLAERGEENHDPHVWIYRVEKARMLERQAAELRTKLDHL